NGAGALPERLSRGEKRLLDFLELNPGGHDVASLEEQVRGSTVAARRLAKSGAVCLWKAEIDERGVFAPISKPVLNADQNVAHQAIRESMRSGQFHTFLLHGVTGSGKTEVYLNAIEVALEMGRSALMLVPEIALTPAMASQFYGRFGDAVAI